MSHILNTSVALLLGSTDCVQPCELTEQINGRRVVGTTRFILRRVKPDVRTCAAHLPLARPGVEGYAFMAARPPCPTHRVARVQPSRRHAKVGPGVVQSVAILVVTQDLRIGDTEDQAMHANYDTDAVNRDRCRSVGGIPTHQRAPVVATDQVEVAGIDHRGEVTDWDGGRRAGAQSVAVAHRFFHAASLALHWGHEKVHLAHPGRPPRGHPAFRRTGTALNARPDHLASQESSRTGAQLTDRTSGMPSRPFLPTAKAGGFSGGLR